MARLKSKTCSVKACTNPIENKKRRLCYACSRVLYYRVKRCMTDPSSLTTYLDRLDLAESRLDFFGYENDDYQL